MFDPIFKLNGLMMHFAGMQTNDVPSDQFTAQPFPDANHPAWIIGHLAYAGDRAVRWFGAAPATPESWGALFGRGSKPVDDLAAYPSKEELVQALAGANDRLVATVRAATPEQLAQPNPLELLARPLPTIGDLCSLLLTTHMAQHLGQLSAWRRAMGMPPQF